MSYRQDSGQTIYSFSMAIAVEMPLVESCTPPQRVISRRWIAYIIVFLVVLTGLCMEHLLRPVPAFPYDDPYIDLHSAQVLHVGFDSNYPGVPALFGVTSAPFVGLIYLFLFVLSPLQALDAACWVGVFLYALGLVRLTSILELRLREQGFLIFIGLAAAPIPFHCLNGLETSCALASITWTLSFAAGIRRGWLMAAFLSGVSATLRPDLLPFAILLIAMLAWLTLRPRPKSTGALISVLTMVFAMAAPVLLCSFWYFHQTGSPFPLTGVAKRYFFAEDHWSMIHRLREVTAQILLFTVIIGPLVLVFPQMGKSALGKVQFAVWILFIAALFVQFPGQLCVNEFRYLVVLIPTLLWGLGSMLKNAVPQQLRQVQRLMYVCAGYAILMLPVCFYCYRTEREFFEGGPRQVTIWCQQHLAPGTSVLIHDAGYLAYSTDFRTVDFVGLKTPSAIAVNRQYTWVSGGNDRALAVSKIASESGTRYLILNSRWRPVVSLDNDLRSLGWKVELLDRSGAFKIYRLTPPAA